jgi:hypothetical protein
MQNIINTGDSIEVAFNKVQGLVNLIIGCMNNHFPGFLHFANHKYSKLLSILLRLPTMKWGILLSFAVQFQ